MTLNKNPPKNKNSVINVREWVIYISLCECAVNDQVLLKKNETKMEKKQLSIKIVCRMSICSSLKGLLLITDIVELWNHKGAAGTAPFFNFQRHIEVFLLTQTQLNTAAPLSYWHYTANSPTVHLFMSMMRRMRASSQLRRGHSTVWSGAMLVSYSEGVLLPLACEITSVMMGVVFLTARQWWQWRSRDIWACQRGKRLSTAAQGSCSPWLTSSLTLPMEAVKGWWSGDLISLKAYLPP